MLSLWPLLNERDRARALGLIAASTLHNAIDVLMTNDRNACWDDGTTTLLEAHAALRDLWADFDSGRI